MKPLCLRGGMYRSGLRHVYEVLFRTYSDKGNRHLTGFRCIRAFKV